MVAKVGNLSVLTWLGGRWGLIDRSWDPGIGHVWDGTDWNDSTQGNWSQGATVASKITGTGDVQFEGMADLSTWQTYTYIHGATEQKFYIGSIAQCGSAEFSKAKEGVTCV